MDITLIRHGKTKMNQEGRYCGVTDVEISPEGIRQIEGIKSHILNSAYDGIYVSPLKRTQQTAGILVDTYKIDNRLAEMNFGIFEGLTYQEIIKTYPVENEKWQKDFLNYRIPKGESLLDVYDRVECFVQEVAKKHKNVLVITHGGVIRCALSAVFGSGEHFFKFHVGHGSITKISMMDGDRWINFEN